MGSVFPSLQRIAVQILQQYLTQQYQKKMGQCTSQKASKHRPHQQVPQDILTFDPQSAHQQKLHFEGILQNVRVQNCPKKAVTIRFEIQDILTLILPNQAPSCGESQLKWKNFQKFSFFSSEYHLRKTFLKISAYDGNKVQLGNMKINLYYVVNGPYHHDFGFKFGNINARLIFDLKISEVINVHFQPKSIQISLLNQYPGQQFNYSFKIIRHDHTDGCLQSDLSSSRSVKLGRNVSDLFKSQMSDMQDWEEQLRSPLLQKKKSNKPKEPSMLHWNSHQDQQMSGFNLLMNTSALRKASVEFVLWKVQAATFYQPQTCRFFAACYFPFNKLLEGQTTTDMRTKLSQKLISFREHLLLNGKITGQVDFSLNLSHKLFYNQSRACARTEDGVVNMTPQFNTYIGRKSNQGQNNFIQKLCSLQRNICQKNMEMNNIDFKIGSSSKITQLRKQMSYNFEDMLNTLSTAYNQFSSFETEKERENIFEEQEKLLNIADKLYPFIQDEDVTFGNVCWSVILNIMKRGKFSLKYMEFTEEETRDIKKKTQSSHLNKKISIALKYQKLVNRILILSLNSTSLNSRKDSCHNPDIFKAYCYVRCPIFRKIVISTISKQQDLTVQQWKFPTLPMSELLTYQQTRKFFLQIFDWETFFYRPLSNNPQSQRLNEELKESLENHRWFKVLGQRNQEYFSFVHNLMVKLEQLCKKAMFDKWHHIPGYNDIVRSLLYEMKRRNIYQYPSGLQQASTSLLANQKLLNIMLIILARKTNSYDQPCVIKTLDLIHSYIYSRTTLLNKPHLPLTFDYLFFFQALKLIIQNSFTYSTCKALQLIFTFYEKFSQEFKRLLVKYLLGRAFFRLFLHWSYPVRRMFHHFLVMKIGQELSSANVNHQEHYNYSLLDVQKQYDYVITVLRKAEEARKNQLKESQTKYHEKELYKIMKKKIYNKRRISIPNRGGKLNHLPSEKSQSSDSDLKLNTPVRRRSETNYVGIPSSNNFRLSTLEAQEDYPDSCDFILTLRHSDQPQNLHSSPKPSKTSGLSSSSSKKHRKDSNNKQNKLQNTQNSSFSQINSINQLCQQGSIPRRRRVSIVSQENFQLCEIQHSEQVYICIAVNEFKNIKGQIQKFVDEKGEMPKIDLGTEVAVDEKEIRPSVADKLQ